MIVKRYKPDPVKGEIKYTTHFAWRKTELDSRDVVWLEFYYKEWVYGTMQDSVNPLRTYVGWSLVKLRRYLPSCESGY